MNVENVLVFIELKSLVIRGAVAIIYKFQSTIALWVFVGMIRNHMYTVVKFWIN